MTRSMITRAATLWLLMALAACSPPPDETPAVTKPAPAPARDLVAEVRAQGVDAPDALEVQPLRDPQVEDLLAATTRHENAKAFDRADASIAQALAIVPNDPALLQHRAEIALAREDYDLAEKLANSSYERGPKLGGLCRRNWATIRVAREMRGQPEAAATAAAQAQRCTVAPPVRM